MEGAAAVDLSLTADTGGQAGARVESGAAAPAQVLSVNTTVGKGTALSPGQIASALENWQRFGYPAEDFIKAARGDGHEITIAPDPRTNQEREYDRTFSGASPEDYKVDWLGRAEGLSPKALIELDGKIRGALSAMNFPALIGPAVMEHAFDDAKIYANLDESGKAIWDAQQRSTLGRIVGFDKVDMALSNARVMLSFVDPALRGQLLEQGLFRSARVVMQLHLQAERWNSRADMALARGAKK